MNGMTTKGYRKFVMPASLAQEMIAQGLLDEDQIIVSQPLPEVLHEEETLP